MHMRIAIIGSRGIPAKYGGFETFAENIAINLLNRYAYTVTVVCDAEQKVTNGAIESFKGIRLTYSRYSKSKNPLLFYFTSVIASVQNNDIIYSCGPTGGVFGLITRFKKRIMATNPDGLNWRRAKWNPLVKKAFRIFEYLASKFSNFMICDSVEIEKHIRTSYRCKKTLVAEYGAEINSYIKSENEKVNTVFMKKILGKYNLEKGRYHLVVSRLEPENNIDMIIKAHKKQKNKYPLVIVGNLKATTYVKGLQSLAGDDIYFLGGIYNRDELAIIRANARDYIHGHSVGGTNPSLLEAMASKNLCICHDNPFNREVLKNYGYYFKNEDELSAIITKTELKDLSEFENMRIQTLERIKKYYNWDNITEKYNRIFKTMIESRG
jgi:rhamnosyltransferase